MNIEIFLLASCNFALFLVAIADETAVPPMTALKVKLVLDMIASTTLVVVVPAVSSKDILSPTLNSLVNDVPEPTTAAEPPDIDMLPVRFNLLANVELVVTVSEV